MLYLFTSDYSPNSSLRTETQRKNGKGKHTRKNRDDVERCKHVVAVEVRDWIMVFPFNMSKQSSNR